MVSKQELQVQQKREVEKAQEPTTPMRAFVPTADIFETEDSLTVVLEMPGVDKQNIDVSVESGVVTVEGKITCINMKVWSRFIANIMWVPTVGASGYPAGSIRIRSGPRCGKAWSL